MAFFAVTFIELTNDTVEFAIQIIILFPFGRAILISAFGYKAPTNPVNRAHQGTNIESLRSFARNYALIFLGGCASFLPLVMTFLLVTGDL